MSEDNVSKPSGKNSVLAEVKNIFMKLEKKLNSSNLPPFLKGRKVLLSGTGIIILLIIILTFLPGTVIDVPTYKVKKENFLVTVTESGEIQAKNAIAISAPRIRGNLKIVYLVPEGTYVNAGDTVAKFDPTEALTNFKDAQSQLEVALTEKQKLIANQKSEMTSLESDLKSAELSYELSKLNLEQMKFEAEIKQRQEKLNHQKNELAFKKAKQAFESRKIIQQSEMNKMDVEVQQKRAELERAKRSLDMLTLITPKEGLVVYKTNWNTRKKFGIGDTPWPGQAIISLPDLSAMESQTYVNEVDVSRISEGQKVVVKLDAFQDSSFNGVISSVAPLGVNKGDDSNVKVFEIVVDILSNSPILKPGMTTSNKIIINEIPDVVYIPLESVFDKEGKKIAYVKNGRGFDEHEVEVGEKSENYVVITNGISENDEVALVDPTIIPDDPDQQQSVELPSSVN